MEYSKSSNYIYLDTDDEFKFFIDIGNNGSNYSSIPQNVIALLIYKISKRNELPYWINKGKDMEDERIYMDRIEKAVKIIYKDVIDVKRESNSIYIYFTDDCIKLPGNDSYNDVIGDEPTNLIEAVKTIYKGVTKAQFMQRSHSDYIFLEVHFNGIYLNLPGIEYYR